MIVAVAASEPSPSVLRGLLREAGGLQREEAASVLGTPAGGEVARNREKGGGGWCGGGGGGKVAVAVAVVRGGERWWWEKGVVVGGGAGMGWCQGKWC